MANPYCQRSGWLLYTTVEKVVGDYFIEFKVQYLKLQNPNLFV